MPDTEFQIDDDARPDEAAQARVRRPYPGFWQALGLFLLLTLLQVVLSLPLALAGVKTHPLAAGLVILVSTGVIIAWARRRTGASLREVLPRGPVHVSIFLPLLLTIVGLTFVVSEMSNLVQSVIPVPASFVKMMEAVIDVKDRPWESFVAAGLVIPLAEELIFRGLFLHGFLARYGARTAIVLSALVFALAHGNPWQFPVGMVMGLLLGWCRVRTGSLVPCVAGHAMNNSLVCGLGALRVDVPGYTDAGVGAVVHQALWLDATGLILAAGGLVLLKRQFDRT